MPAETTETKLERLAHIEGRIVRWQAVNTEQITELEAHPPGPIDSLKDQAEYKARAAYLLGRQEVISDLAHLIFGQV